MTNGIWMIIVAFIIIIVSTILGIYFTKKYQKEDDKKKYVPITLIISTAIALSAGYVFGAKRYSENIDLVISWLILAMGLYFSAGIIFFTSFLSSVIKADED